MIASSFGRSPALLLFSALLLACAGCAEPAPAPPPAATTVAVVEEVDSPTETDVAVVTEESDSSGDTAIVIEEEAVLADASQASAGEKIAELVKLLGAESADGRTRVVSIDEIAALRGDADLTLEPLMAVLADEEPRVRWHAARALGLLGKDALPAVPALVKLLADSDPVVVTQAAAAIGSIRADDDRDAIPAADAAVYAATVEPLVATLVHPDPRARRAVIRALRRVSTSREELAKTVRRQLADSDPIAVMPALHTLADMGDDAVPFLVESLDDPASRYWAEVVLAEIGPGAAPAVESLAKLVREGEIPEQVQAILALAEIGPAAAPATEAVVAALGSPDNALRYVAAFALGKIAPEGADDALKQAAGSDDPFLATLASWALANLHPDDASLVAAAVARLREGLASEAPAVRNAAIEGLSDLAPHLAEADRAGLAEAFAHLIADPVPAVGLAAGGGLIRLGGEAVVALRQAVADPAVRSDALEILSAIGPASLPALDDMVAALADSDPACRSDAALAIASIGPDAKAAVPALEKLLGDESAEAGVRYTAAFALGKIGPDAAAAEPLLRKLVTSEDELLATVSVWAALKIRPDDAELFATAVPKLRRALQDEREMVRLEAVVALGEIGQAAGSARPMLELLAEDDPSRDVRSAAEAALDQIGE